MKKLLVIGFAMLLGMSAMAQISGTAHDFSGDAWNASGEICIVCHAPHNNRDLSGDATLSGAPLWNRDVTGSTFTLYTSDTMDATMGQPGGTSKLCLSCHDGTIGLESFGTTTGSTTNLVSGTALLGTDLSNDHPISIEYAATGETGLNPAAGLDPAITLFGGNVECASCHDVHDDSNGQFLVMDNAASALCLECHNK